MQDSYETLLLERREPGVLVVTMNRPATMNAMNTQMGLDMLDLFGSVGLHPDLCRAIVLTGAGERAFCAGGDLKQRQGMTDQQWQAQHHVFEAKVRAMIDCPVPLIAAVNGVAYGGGCEMALCCDFIYAASTARFALPEVTLGIMPGAGGTQNLPRAVGERRAKELLLSGKPWSAADAMEWGMVNRVCEPTSLVEDAVATATTIAGNAPISIRQAKRSMHHGLSMSLADGLLFEVEAYNRMVPTEDRREGVLAFAEKRKPNFKGR